MNNSPAHARQRSGDQYYEDIEPRFAEETNTGGNSVPSVLMAGRPAGEQLHHPSPPTPPPLLKIPGETVGDLAPGSPAISDISQGSHFTSISERPINPKWQGAPPPPVPQNRGPQMQDMLLEGNPDFELPGATPRVGRGGGGSRYGRGGRMTPVVENSGSRYPS